MAEYIPRFADATISRLLQDLPGVLLVGPRATGKTTTGSRFARTTVHLDDPDTAKTFEMNINAALREMPEPVLIDEWQMVPPILGALKRTIDADHRPGRYIVTGSVRTDLESPGWAATGRLTRVAMYGLTERERQRKAETTFIDSVVDSNFPTVFGESPDARDYVEIAMRSGFPEFNAPVNERTRQDWIAGYLEQVITRDVYEIADIRDPAGMRRYFEAFCLNTAGIVHDSALAKSAQLTSKTAKAYQHLLENLLVIENVPAWRNNRFTRLSQSPKRYVLDPTFLAATIRAGVDTIFRDPNLLGRVLDTYIAAQLRAEMSASMHAPRMYHLRDEQGRHEVDILLELAGFGFIGIEVKASASPDKDAAKHLIWLRDQLGDRFLQGIVFYTGQYGIELSERILALPICALWS